MGRVGWMIISDDDPSSSAKPTMERISKYVRETAGWMWGWMSVAPELRQTSQLARHSSVDIDDAPGCCPAKILISSIVSFATPKQSVAYLYGDVYLCLRFSVLNIVAVYQGGHTLQDKELSGGRPSHSLDSPECTAGHPSSAPASRRLHSTVYLMTAEVARSPESLNQAENQRFGTIRTVLGEWKQLFDSCGFIRRKRRSPVRSRRKEGKEKQVSKRVASAAYAPRQPPKSSDLCVCDSIDDKTVKKFTTLPTGIDQREWIAHNTLGLFDHVSALSGCISELCTPVTCPHMSFPGTSKAPYVDDRGKRQNYPAMQYIDCAMTSCEQISRNEDIFPTKYGSKFSNDFEPTVKRMLRMLWHCIGHLYTKHWEHMGALELRPQVALVLAHLSELGKSFNLIDPKDQVHVDNTVIMIRPILAIASPLGVSEDQGERKSENSDRATRVPTSKSGSWGGYPSPSVLSCKPYSQTC
ncbi:unnamed protein product [Caenorhabditis auriculariae]|uniref:Uncharacterized protein n=1 Tax=Caenorhabditis auriculariae TaxID=2777116 RepID=A0A8S1HXI5_9PELO|nr:unnamed protein product [Caenorhabditis auriculariae]